MKQSEQNSPNALSIIREAGLHATAARVSVLNVLLLAEHALTHNEIEKAVGANDGAIERVTLYRVLDWLVNQELAHKITGLDRVWRFNAQAHPAPHHAHFTCTCCSQVFCLENLHPMFTGTLPDGFRLTQVDVSLLGTCPRCSR
uniref:Fur family transcriptional regulator, ferric uptake regulator n=1 Tax=Candidatus Kentrum sp. FW TaxID=2126338 RepID=A0A450SF88_9GAMM|nr:MAG: Fur family transcriptional regulator, ferric uptake regulator [Candidatus Kentron sp. FW]VFJ57616.1 MAG: Fur family transcriptional regulator, ferric uptake regulator [Candidatus Kentron sp. FW]